VGRRLTDEEWAEAIRKFERTAFRLEQERWAGQQTIAAGEVIRYMSRQCAHEVGLLPAAGEDDWWLLDDDRLVVMRFNDDGRLVENELVTDPERVAQACAWRDLAGHHSAPDFTGVPLP
jgi:hypothetical protein